MNDSRQMNDELALSDFPQKMAQGTNYMNSNPTQFLNKGETEAIGWFVTTKKALALVVLAILTLIVVIVFMYYYGPNRKIIQIQEDNDIEEIIKEGIENKVVKDIRLPKSLMPINYKLRIHPEIDPNNSTTFTYSGEIQITVSCKEKTDTIVLNWHNVQVDDSILVDRIKYSNDVLKPVNNHEIIGSNIEVMNLNLENNGTSTEYNDEIKSMNSSKSKSIKTTVEHALKIENLLKSDKSIGIVEITRDKENDKIILQLEESLEVNTNYTIHMKFSGNILDNLIGLYKTSYNTSEGEIRWIITTDFEPIYARRVFPCFDEPSFKATFDLSVARRNDMVTLSNMPVKSSELMAERSDWTWDHFERTPPMSTYSLAFTVSQFESLECTENCPSSFKLRMWGHKSDLTRSDFALTSARDMINYLEHYFDAKYPLPKLDLLIMPNLGQPATENWGLISFRKSSILFDPAKESVLLKPQIFNILCRNIIKQWLGNLVSIKWWSELWLKEGLAMMLSTKIEKDLRPEWDTYNNNPLMEIESSLFEDSLDSSSSLRSKIVDNKQIEQITDSIIYEKGSSLLRMLNGTVSQDVFEETIRNYLRTFSYKSAGQDEFWVTIIKIMENRNESFGSDWNSRNLKIVMDSWTTQPGYPCITVKKIDNRSSSYYISQKKFGDEKNFTNLWYVPITYITKNNRDIRSTWLNDQKSTTIDSEEFADDSWILVNFKREGFYRVNYDEANWKLLREQLKIDHTEIPLYNRAQLLDDSFEQAKIGNINYSIPFELTNFLKFNESSYVAWYPALKNLKYIKTIMDYHEYSGIYHTFLINLIAKRFNLLGTSPKPTESLNDKFLRLDIIHLACQLYYEPCIDWAKAQLKRWMEQKEPDKNNPIHRDYRRIVQCMAIEKGSRREWYFLWDRTFNPNISPEDLNVIYSSLGCTHDLWLINKYLHLSLIGNISLEYVPLVWNSLSHPVGLRTAFPFLRLNWKNIYATYNDTFFVMKVIVGDFLSNLATEIDLEDLTQFYKTNQNDLEPLVNILQETVNKIKLRIEWKRRHLESVKDWLYINVKKSR